MADGEPAQITLTVFSARDLQSKRKGEKCQASVVFGLGKNQYITEVLESNSPEWNQEAVISVPPKNQHHNVKFKVRDKEHVIGVVSLTLASLGGHRESSKRWIPLSPHKKGHEAFGELQLECFVSQYRPGHSAATSFSEASSPVSSPQTGSQEDILNPKRGRRFSLHRRTPSWTKGSLGNVDISRQNAEPVLSELQSFSKQTSEAHSESSSIADVSPRPQVTGISPHEGPVQGGQRVVLRGSNLGDCKESVLKVLLADVDCTGSLEYFSSSKLAVTTPPRHAPSRGAVQVQTVHGGVGVSSIEFAFVESEKATPPEVTGISPREGPVSGGQRVVLRGSNLGECKEDVVRVVIADVDCMKTLEYFSPAKLAVTTLPRQAPGSGQVLIETVRGGASHSSLTFSFTPKDSPERHPPHSRTHSRTSSIGNSRKILQQQEADQAELKLLRQQIKDLKDDNVQLRERNQALVGYIDTLLLSIIEKKPDILEVKSFQPSSASSTSSSVTV